MTKYVIYILISFSFISCSPRLYITNAKDKPLKEINNCNYVFGVNELLPDSTKVLADFKTKGFLFQFKKYGVNESMDLIAEKSSELNYNAIRIERIDFPGLLKSKSYDIKGEFLFLNECPDEKYRLVDEATDENKNYIKLYRQNRAYGSGISYPIFFNEHFICGLDNNKKIIIEVPSSEDENKLQIESYGKRFTIPIDFKKSNVVYINCRVGDAAFPKIKFEEEEIGKKKFERKKRVHNNN